MNAESKTEHDRAKRKALLTTATFEHDGGGRVSVRVRNLSDTGLGGVSSDPVTKDEIYCVELKGIGQVRGHVAWVSGTRFGLRFDEPIKLDALEMSEPALAERFDAVEFYKNYRPPEIYRRPSLSKHR